MIPKAPRHPHLPEPELDFTLYEKTARQKGYSRIAGIDEAGRGPLAGPVVAAACILPLSEGFSIEGIDDSKKLTARQRAQAFERLTKDPAVRWGIGVIDAPTIDRINILQATIQAMIQAVEELGRLGGLDKEPDFLLVDGLDLPYSHIPTQKIIRGDSLSASIAAASILAKETRDRLMIAFDKQWPEYGFAQHKGYPTKKHREAIAKQGTSPIHRLTFAGCRLD